MGESITLKGKGLEIESLVAVARNGAPVVVADEAWTRINSCRSFVERRIANHEPMYGITTGIGEFSETLLTPEQTLEFQKLLIYSHTAGIGDPLPVEVVRGAICSRINVHCHGHSGGRARVTEAMVDLLNHHITPVVCEKGSVGACGDLSPMGQVALTLMGEGEAFLDGKRISSSDALKARGLSPLTLQPRDGLCIINGSNMLTAWAALLLHDISDWLKVHDTLAAMTLESLKANMVPYDERLHTLRGFSGSGITARNILALTEGSEILSLPEKKVQDAYSMRSTPQVVGTLRDAVSYARSQVETELNGVGDNPLFLPKEDTILTGANFQGSPVALPMEMVGVGLSMCSVLSERRLNRLLNPALSVGLPPFLAKKPGLHSGLMLSQYTAGALVAENRILSHPAANQSIPAAADQEDFVSMGFTTSQKTAQMLENAWGILAIEAIAAAQALDLRAPHKPGYGVEAARLAVRSVVPKL